MRLTLFTSEKIYEFFLPNQISGSYSFGDTAIEEEKIVTVEAIENEWHLLGKDGATIVFNNQCITEIPLALNEFYAIQKDNITYYLLVSPIYSGESIVYNYNANVNIVIGTSDQCNVRYNLPFFSGIMANIKIVNNQLQLSTSPEIVAYVNNEKIIGNENILKLGHSLNIFGLRMIFLPNKFIINNPYKGVMINELSCNIEKFEYVPDKYQNLEVKEDTLYSKDQYFTKSPRIRRTIESKEIKIDPPPAPPKADEIPAILTAGPMISMGAMAGMTLLNTITQVTSGATTLAKSWISIASGVIMLTTSLVWPFLTKTFNKHLTRDKRREVVAMYNKYLMNKEAELKKEIIVQKNILDENLITPIECLKIINTRKNNFWCKRVDQSDFLTVRIGRGNIPLKVDIKWPEEGPTVEQDELKQMAEQIIERNKYIEDSPQEYSFYENFLTAIMGIEKKCYGLMHNILVQLFTFYCYDELKVIVFTNEKKAKKWDYLKYSNYCFNTEKNVRFFSTNVDEARELSSYLMQELNYKIQISNNGENELTEQKPYYLIICDDYNAYKKNDFFKTLLELDKNIGYSTVIIENKLDRLPSKCFNFINLNEGSSGILKNSYEKAEITNFRDEIDYNINMMEIIKILSNIPVEIETAGGKLPESIDFLEMEKVGKVEKLNILNRWKNNDSTKTLRAEVGVDEEGNLMYLDLHEKFHGPHGLIAGTTGSGKSEFIITYILSLAMNYSPDDVSFILIDYKGGGLAFAFENKLTGVKLPHLAGTITNLDKAEMNRTLVSIDSEVKRRQAEFNKARDLLGESTIDIYKYQRFYHEGKLKDPIPHLFIISDEFAELKSQQPEFMDNLISVARIGRSLGVHLILATQKPSGVVNDQIWSNTKFRVCLKVADASDSNEMLKKPDAALLKQSGRFYLQVGMDEYYALGQSGWAGAKYFPSDKMLTKIDNSIDFIDNNGQIIKTIKESNNKAKVEAQGEQLAAIMGEIINVANQVNKKSKTLWLDNIPQMILLDNIEKKYNIVPKPYEVQAIIGEYDAPELQEQGIVTYSPIENGNLLICGTEGAEREQLLNAIIYTICKNHSPEEVNFYTVDYGSESLRMFAPLPHFGGMVFTGDNEKYVNLTKMLREETTKRKKLFVDYGGDYKNYIKNSGQKLPLKIVIINNYDTIKESIPDAYEDTPELLRDSERYGIVYIVTGNGSATTGTRVNQNIETFYALKLKDQYEYSELLGAKTKQVPQETPGRGMLNNGAVHEFQTGFIVENEAELSKYIIDFNKIQKDKYPTKAQRIPILPEHVRLEDIIDNAQGLKQVPVGIMKNKLEEQFIDFTNNVGKLILSNKLNNTNNFTRSLLDLFKNMKIATIVIDGTGDLASDKSNVSNYFDSNYDEVMGKVISFIESREKQQTANEVVMCIYGFDKFVRKINDVDKFEEMIAKIKKYEKMPLILIDEVSKIKSFVTDPWYKSIFPSPDGVWVGTGVVEQTVLRVSGYNKENTLEYPNDMGFYVADGSATIIKLLDFISQDGDVE